MTRSKQRGFLLNPFRFGGGGGGGGSFSHDWATLSPFYSPIQSTPFRLQTGTVSVSGNKLIATNYGSDASWHGPAVQTVVPECTNFEFSFTYSFANPSNDPQMLGRIVVFLQTYSDGQTPFMFTAADSQAGNNTKRTSVSVNNNPVAGSGTTVWADSNTVDAVNVLVVIRRESGVLTVTHNGTIVYSGSDMGAGSFDAIAVQLSQFGTYPPYSPVNIGPLALEYL